jgi:hypothetical protein
LLFLGACRQYLPRAKPCAVYETDYVGNDDDDDDNINRGKCKKNEECLPPNDRAKHGYCQCKLGFIRKSDNGKCVVNNEKTFSTTSSTPISSLFDIEVQAGDDQIITLPTDQIDLYGRVLYKSNKSEINISMLNNRNLTLFWSLKSSTNGAKIDISKQEDLTSHILVKQLREGIYEFELKLNNKEGITLTSDIVKIEVVSGKKNESFSPYPSLDRAREMSSKKVP